MKKLLLGMLLTLCLSTPAQNVINNTIYNIQSYVDASLSELGIKDSSYLIVVQGTGNFHTSTETCTVWNPSAPLVFSLYVSELNYYDFMLMLAHELVHVKQLLRRELVTKKATYCEDYAKSLSYDKRFEDEANRLGKELYGKFKNLR